MPKCEPATATKPNYNIHAVEKVLDLLNAICDGGGEVRLTELSERLGLSKANVFRLLATLENRGMVVRGDDSRKYRLGLTAYEMGQKLLSGMEITRKSRPVMERLARASNEAVYLAVPCKDELLLLDMVDSSQQIKVAPLVGRRLPLASTPLGQLVHALTPRGRNTSPAKDELNRSFGVTDDGNSFGDGVTTLGIPLFNAREQVVAVLAIIGPTFRIFTEQRRKELLQLLSDAGAAISTSLGYTPLYFRSSYAN